MQAVSLTAIYGRNPDILAKVSRSKDLRKLAYAGIFGGRLSSQIARFRIKSFNAPELRGLFPHLPVFIRNYPRIHDC
jgi:hypothetical protein